MISPVISVRPATVDRFAPQTNQQLGSAERRAYVRDLAGQPIPPGVLAYNDDTVVGWTGVAPRDQVYSIAHSTLIITRRYLD